MTESVRRRLRSTSSTRPGGAEVREEEVDPLELLLAPRRRACACPSCRPSTTCRRPPRSRRGPSGSPGRSRRWCCRDAGCRWSRTRACGRRYRGPSRACRSRRLGRGGCAGARRRLRSCCAHVSPYGLLMVRVATGKETGRRVTIHASSSPLSSCLVRLAASDFPLNLFIAAVRPRVDDRLDGVGRQPDQRRGAPSPRRPRSSPARSRPHRGPAAGRPTPTRTRANGRRPDRRCSERTPLWPPWPPPAPSLRRPNGRSSSSCTTTTLGDRNLPEAGHPRDRLSAEVHELHRLAEQDALARRA